MFHPAFGYFADAYGLKQKSVETEGKAPTPRQLRRWCKQARAEGVKVIFLQPQFESARPRRSPRRSAARSCRSTLAPDVLQNLDDVAAKIAAVVSREGKS